MKRLLPGLILAGMLAAPGIAEDKASSSAISMDELAKAIADYSSEDAELKGGYFMVYDMVEKKPLLLKLDKVHHDRLARLSNGVYFACADYKNADGVLYDLDVFMQGPSADRLTATEVSVHKKDGKARYGWKEEKGNWVKVKSGNQ